MRGPIRALRAAFTLAAAGGLVTGLVVGRSDGAALAAATPVPVTSPPSGGPASRYDCALNLTTGAFNGVDATASAIGWEGNGRGVVTCLGGAFLVQERNFANYGFGIYDGSPTTWSDVDGYLPAQVTSFRRFGADIAITEFADRLELGGDAYVAVYCRVAVTNPTSKVVDADPSPSPGLIPLDTEPDAAAPHSTSVHDYVVAVDRFGNSYAWPTAAALQRAGGYEQHFAHMRAFWQSQLAAIAQVHVPVPALDDAYRAGFIETQIARSGNDLDTGVNGYQIEYSHDVIGILTNLFTQGYFTDAHSLLLEARDVVNAVNPQGPYVDGLWTYSLPWAVYLMKTGDIGFVKANFATAGPAGAVQPSIEYAAHQIAADRTGPSSTMEATDDIDTEGYWTTDDYEALLGLAAYAYLAGRVGDVAEKAWAQRQYAGLLAATNSVLDATIGRYHLDYLPCSLIQPNTANRCADPEDANWASPLADNWAWVGTLLGATVDGPGSSLIDATYTYGFARLRGRLPPETFGGYPGDYYSSGYNAAYGTAGLAGGPAYRDQGIMGYEFMIAHSQSGPYSFWESSSAPSTRTPWIGEHPTSGQGSSPHAWGMAGADKVLLDSIVAQAADGSLVVGRGIPDAWLGRAPTSVDNFPGDDGRRLGVGIAAHGRSVSLTVRGRLPPGRILFELPAFVENVATTSAGTVDQRTGTVALPAGTHHVIVTLRRLPA